MDHKDTAALASRLAADVLAARVGAATARPSAGEGREAAAYYRQVFAEIMRGLGTPVGADE